jgi:hypothetical protein
MTDEQRHALHHGLDAVQGLAGKIAVNGSTHGPLPSGNRASEYGRHVCRGWPLRTRCWSRSSMARAGRTTSA